MSARKISSTSEIYSYLTVNTLYLRGVVQEVVRQLFRSSTAEELLRQRVDGSLFNVLKSFCELIDATLVHTVDTKKKQRRECLVAHLFQLAERPHRPVTMDEMRLVCEVAFVEQAALNAFESSELFDLDMTFQPYSSVKALTISVMSAPGADELVDIVLNDNSCPVPITGLLEELDLTVSTEADQQNYQKKIVPWQQMDVSLTCLLSIPCVFDFFDLNFGPDFWRIRVLEHPTWLQAPRDHCCRVDGEEIS